MNNQIKRAELLACLVHMGQKRRDGEDYIKHCERMVIAYLKSIGKENELDSIGPSSLTTMQSRIVCAIWLHDTREDAEYPGVITLMLDTYFDGDISDIVDILTYSDRESYNEYITRVFQHPTAWQIKWLDMIDNTSYKTTKKQKTKYRDACIHLIAHGVTVPEILKERLKI